MLAAVSQAGTVLHTPQARHPEGTSSTQGTLKAPPALELASQSSSIALDWLARCKVQGARRRQNVQLKTLEQRSTLGSGSWRGRGQDGGTQSGDTKGGDGGKAPAQRAATPRAAMRQGAGTESLPDIQYGMVDCSQ